MLKCSGPGRGEAPPQPAVARCSGRGYNGIMRIGPRNLRCFLAVCAPLLLLTSGCASYRGARLFQSGSEALDRGDVATAVADLERAAWLLPNASEIQNHLGIAYTEAGRHHAAYSAYQRAVDLDCSNAAAQHNLRVAEALAVWSSERIAGPGEDAPKGEVQ